MRRLVPLIAAILLAGAVPASATSIVVANVFTTTAISVSVGVFSFGPFNPLLSTLDSIDVSIEGQIRVSRATHPNLGGGDGGGGGGVGGGGGGGVGGGGGAVLTPPSPISVGVAQSFGGEAGEHFQFTTPADVTLAGVASGLGATQLLTSDFAYSMSFDSLTDPIGFDIPTFPATGSVSATPPVSVSGSRSDHLQTAVPLDVIDVNRSAAGTGFVSPIVFSTAIPGGFSPTTYPYTQAAAADLTPVPEPATLLLTGVGIAAAVWRKRRA